MAEYLQHHQHPTDHSLTITPGLKSDDFSGLIELFSKPKIMKHVLALRKVMMAREPNVQQLEVLIAAIETDCKDEIEEYTRLMSPMYREPVTELGVKSHVRKYTKYSDSTKTTGTPLKGEFINPMKLFQFFPHTKTITVSQQTVVRNKALQSSGCKAEFIRDNPEILVLNYPKRLLKAKYEVGFELRVDHHKLLQQGLAVRKGKLFELQYNNRPVLEKEIKPYFPVQQSVGSVDLCYVDTVATVDATFVETEGEIIDKFPSKIQHISPEHVRQYVAKEVTPKVDGTLVYLLVKNRMAYILGSDSEKRGKLLSYPVIMSSPTEAPDLLLEMEAVDLPDRMVLCALRILRYKGLCLPYNLSDLGKVKYRMNIDVVSADLLPSDGEIWHVEDPFYQQLYYKPKVTHDLDHDTALTIDPTIEPFKGIVEFEIEEQKLKKVKPRKKTISDDLDEVLKKEVASSLANIAKGNINEKRLKILHACNAIYRNPELSAVKGRGRKEMRQHIMDLNTTLNDRLILFLDDKTIPVKEQFEIDGVLTTKSVVYGNHLVYDGVDTGVAVDPITFRGLISKGCKSNEPLPHYLLNYMQRVHTAIKNGEERYIANNYNYPPLTRFFGMGQHFGEAPKNKKRKKKRVRFEEPVSAKEKEAEEKEKVPPARGVRCLNCGIHPLVGKYVSLEITDDGPNPMVMVGGDIKNYYINADY